MTVRLSAIFEDHMEKIINNWKMAKKKQNRRRNKVSSSNSDISVTGSSETSDNEVQPEQLTGSQDDDSADDEIPLTVLRSKQNTTESDTTSMTSQSHSTVSKTRIKVKSPQLDEEYSPAAGISNSNRRKRAYRTSSEDEEEFSQSSSDEEDEQFGHRKSLRQRPIKKKVLLYETSDSETNCSLSRRRKKIRKPSESDSDSKSSRTTLNSDRNFSVSSRGRVRKFTERAKHLFGKR